MEGGGKPPVGRMGPSADEAAGGAGGMSEKQLQRWLEKANAAVAASSSQRAAGEPTSRCGLQKELTKVATSKKKLAMQLAPPTARRPICGQDRAARGGARRFRRRSGRSWRASTRSSRRQKRLPRRRPRSTPPTRRWPSRWSRCSRWAAQAARAKGQEGLAEQLRGVEKQLSLATAKAEGGEKAVERIEASGEGDADGQGSRGQDRGEGGVQGARGRRMEVRKSTRRKLG